MTFPAWHSFDTDRRIGVRHIRVYQDLRTYLDFREPRARKVAVIAHTTKLDPSNVARALRDLVRWGYVLQVSQDRDGLRHFTLAWSVAKSTSSGQADAA